MQTTKKVCAQTFQITEHARGLLIPIFEQRDDVDFLSTVEVPYSVCAVCMSKRPTRVIQFQKTPPFSILRSLPQVHCTQRVSESRPPDSPLPEAS